jgi:hypothetical protein
MSNNVFSGKRLQLLFKQNFIHNTQFLLLSTVAYIGIIFIVLSFAQVGNDLQPNDLNNFQGFLLGFVTVFGILYVGHSFPAFREKESTIHYLMTPASALEKFFFEFVNRIVIMLLALPLLYWATFNMQGYFFDLFTKEVFEPIGFQHMVKLDDPPPDDQFLIYALITGGVLFALSLAFTGAAMFTKQPLVKSLFAVALVVMFFVGYSYIIIEPLGVGRYNPPEYMILIPAEEGRALATITVALFAATILLLFVAFRKLKEREV